MYAGESERQLSALAQTNQALANEQYNQKMAALQAAQFLNSTDDVRKENEIRKATRTGVISQLLGNIKDKVISPDHAINTLSTNNVVLNKLGTGTQGLQSSNTNVKPLNDKVYGGTGAVQGEMLNRLLDPKSPDYNPKQYEMMVRQSQMSPDTGGLKNALNPEDRYLYDRDEELHQRQNMDAYREKDKYYKDVNKEIDSQNKAITKENDRLIKAEQKQKEKLVQKNPELAWADHVQNGKAVNQVTEVKGNRSDQQNALTKMFKEQIEFFMANGNKKAAQQAKREYFQNAKQVDESWGKKWDGFDPFADVSDGKGEEYVDVGINAQFDKNGNYEPTRNEPIPKSVYRKGRLAVTEYLNRREGAIGADGKPVEGASPIINLTMVKPATGDSKISAESVAYGDGISNLAFAKAETRKDDKLGDIKVIVQNGVARYRKVNPSKKDIKDGVAAGILE